MPEGSLGVDSIGLTGTNTGNVKFCLFFPKPLDVAFSPITMEPVGGKSVNFRYSFVRRGRCS